MTAWREYTIAAPPTLHGKEILFPFKDYRETLAEIKAKLGNEKTWGKRDLDALRGMCWHQTLSTDSVTGNAKYHMRPNHISKSGLPGLSYTFFIDKPGWVYLCNDLDDKPYSQGDRNTPGDENALYMSCVFGGNFSAPGYVGPDKPTTAQIRSGLALWDWAKDAFGFTNNQLFGHYDFGKPTCPGTVLTGVIEAVNQDKDWDESDQPRDLDSSYGRQVALIDLGYLPAGSADGIWGGQSKGALVEFQEKADLVPDGVWGRKTEAAVRSALAELPDKPDDE